jgi:hypothetical protein
MVKDLKERLVNGDDNERQYVREARIVLHSLLEEAHDEITRLEKENNRQDRHLREAYADRDFHSYASGLLGYEIERAEKLLRAAEKKIVTLYNTIAPSSEGRFADADEDVKRIRQYLIDIGAEPDKENK